MKIRALGRQVFDEVKLRATERLYGLAEKVVDGALAIDLSATKRFISGKIEFSDWVSRQAAAVRNHVFSLPEIREAVIKAGFISAEEAAAAIKAVNGKLKNAGGGQFHPGSWPVFTGFANEYHANKSAYVHFLLFLCRVGNGNAFNRIDFSHASKILFDRARGAGLLLELVNSSPVGIYAVASNPILHLHKQLAQLPKALRLVL